MPRQISFAAFAAAALIWACPAGAAVIQPNITTDVVNSSDGHCSLREAVQAANTDAPPPAVPGECAGGESGVPDEIVLGNGTYHLKLDDGTPGADDNQDDDLNILEPVSITGQGPNDTTIHVEMGDRAMQIHPASGTDPIAVTLDGMTISGGRSETGGTADSDPQFGKAGDWGGAVWAENVDLTLTHCAFEDNRTGAGASGDPAAVNANGSVGGEGGAVAQIGSGGVAVDGCTFHDNHTGNGGNGATPTTSHVQAGSGVSGGSGGAISVGTPTQLTIANSTFIGNGTGAGGAGGSPGPSPATQFEAAGGSGGPGGDGGAVSTGGQFQHAAISNSSFSQNTTGNGGPAGAAALGTNGFAGAAGAGGSGGAILWVGGNTLTAVSVTGNHTGNGGAAAPSDASNTQLFGAAGSGGSGGGYAGFTGDLSISDSTFSGNTAGDGARESPKSTAGGGGSGGGLLLGHDTVAITGTTVSGNASGRGGDAAFSPGLGGRGGGIFRSHGTLSLVNSTITGNSGGPGGAAETGSGPGANGGHGGGIFVGAGATMTASYVTMAGNAGGPSGPNTSGAHPRPAGPGFAGALSLGQAQGFDPATAALSSSVLANNGAFACEGAISASTSDTIAFDPVSPSCPGRDVDPLLGPLANNGGPTLTAALGAGSPALDIGVAPCPATDQRGQPRPQGGQCDAGAFERPVQVPPSETTPPTGQPPDTTPPTIQPTDTTPPTISIAIGRQRLGRALAHGLNVDVTTSEGGKGVLELFVRRGGKLVRVARGSRTFARATKGRVVAKFTAAARKRYRRSRKLKLTARVAVTDLAGNAARLSRTVTLKR